MKHKNTFFWAIISICMLVQYFLDFFKDGEIPSELLVIPAFTALCFVDLFYVYISVNKKQTNPNLKY